MANDQLVYHLVLERPLKIVLYAKNGRAYLNMPGVNDPLVATDQSNLVIEIKPVPALEMRPVAISVSRQKP